ncbi:sensor histidine kinase [Kitasatospora sp. NPDC057198]|uniref:sensor histidine kinase n=1 Tax=Kitasatospora sp. NPDC057198 TaxID=3346046 RepID=UPI00364216DE
MLTAAAVAVAIAVAAAACWFLVEDQLDRQVRSNLAAAPMDPTFGMPNSGQGDPNGVKSVPVACGTTAAQAQEQAEKEWSTSNGHGRYNRWPSQLLAPSGGQVCLPFGSVSGIVTTPADLDAVGTAGFTIREGSFVDGDSALVRVSTVPVNGERWVLLTAVSTQSVDDSLRQLAVVLSCVALAGVAVAGVAGRVVARSALKPVDQLTDVVEHIARTEEVGTTIPVHGKDEIARLSTSFNSMSTALANSRERQTRLIADAGHELRTPLTSLRTNVDLLIRSDAQGRALPPETRARMLGNMKAQMQELTLLIGDLLQLSRPDTPNPEAVRTVVPFHETVERALERGRLRGPSLVFDTDVRPWYVHGDPAALERAVVNLLDNAVKYSPPAGTIDLRLQDGRLTVRDHGPGIPAEELPYVFDRFWRSPSSRQLPGSGLGLSIVAQTVQDTGGQVSLGPAPDGGPGTQAVIVLPGQPDEPR